MISTSSVIILIFHITNYVFASSASVCKWDSKSGAHFDLSPLMLTHSQDSCYNIFDGDIPCTPETEPSYGYVWNFCSSVTAASVPQPCLDVGKNGVVLQYISYSANLSYCYIVGHYESTQNEIKYSLLDVANPAYGISVTYPPGERCAKYNTLRTATVDVICDPANLLIISAQEPSYCNYHFVMKSNKGCPTECPITGNGLCNGHGHCHYDPVKKVPYCYCNSGYYGNSCSSTTSATVVTYDGFSVQLGLLITLLILAFGLTGAVIYMAYRIMEFRKEQMPSSYRSLPGENEMVETVNF